MSDKVNIDRAERIAKLMREKGITSNQISTRTGLAYSTVQHIVAGKPTTRLHEVARVLDTTADQLNGESPPIDRLPTYTLANVPVCDEPCLIRMQSDELQYNGRPQFAERGIITVLVEPATNAELEKSRYALFRRIDETRALVCHVITDGDRVAFARAGVAAGSTLAASDVLVPGQDGELLGALRRVVDAPFLLDQLI